MPGTRLSSRAGVPRDHPLAGRSSVRVDDLTDQPFITAREGHLGRGLFDRFFAARGRTPRIVCEVDEHSANADLIGAGLGVGFVPAAARRLAAGVPGVWLPVDNPDCRRVVTLSWGAGHHLSTAARLMRTTLTEWDWHTGQPVVH